MIQITRWSPDTCKCILEYQWDDQIPEEEREHTVYNVVSTCPEHAGSTPVEVFENVLELNQAFNEALAENDSH